MGKGLNVVLNAPKLLWRAKFLIILITAASVLAAWVQVQRSPRTYSSEETLLYRFGREYFPVTPGEQRRNWGENVMVTLDAALFTEMRLITSHKLYEKTLDNVGLDKVAPSAAPGGAAASETPGALSKAASSLASSFDVWRVQGASMVTVSARNSDPAVADALVDAHVKNYLQDRQGLFDRNSTQFFDEQIVRVREEHDTVAAEVANLAAKAGSTDLRSDLAAAQGEIARLEGFEPVAKLDPDYQLNLKAAEARLETLNRVVLDLQPLETQLAAINTNLATLEDERASAELSQAYRAEVSPVVEVVDHKSAAGNPIGLAPPVVLAMAGVFGLAFACLLVLTVAAVGALRESEDETPA